MSDKTICADIDRIRFSLHNVEVLRKQFPRLDDSTLARYLVAKNDNVNRAVEQLTKAEKLKRDYWHIKKEQCINEIKKGTAYIHGYDKEGRPLIIIHARMHLLDNRNLKESVLMTLWWTELAISMLPDDKSRFTILLDRDNCDNPPDTEYMSAIAHVFQVNTSTICVSLLLCVLIIMSYARRTCMLSACTRPSCTPLASCTTACGTWR